jgi:peroxiredoxin
MKKPGATFVWGCLTGFVLGAAGLLGAGIGGAYLFKDQLVSYKEKNLMAPPITSGQKAAYDWSVTGLDGQVFSMTETQGEAVFLHFWHPECVICEAETAAINQLYDTLKGSGVTFACISKDSMESLKETVEKLGIQFPVYQLTGERPEVYQTPSIPATFFLSPNGDIAFKHVGGAKWDDPMAVEYLRILAAVPAP